MQITPPTVEVVRVRLGAGMQRTVAVRVGAGMQGSAVRLGAGMQPAPAQRPTLGAPPPNAAAVPACVADAGRVRLGAGMRRV